MNLYFVFKVQSIHWNDGVDGEIWLAHLNTSGIDTREICCLQATRRSHPCPCLCPCCASQHPLSGELVDLACPRLFVVVIGVSIPNLPPTPSPPEQETVLDLQQPPCSTPSTPRHAGHQTTSPPLVRDNAHQALIFHVLLACMFHCRPGSDVVQVWETRTMQTIARELEFEKGLTFARAWAWATTIGSRGARLPRTRTPNVCVVFAAVVVVARLGNGALGPRSSLVLALVSSRVPFPSPRRPPLITPPLGGVSYGLGSALKEEELRWFPSF